MLTSPFLGLCGLVSFEEVGVGCRLVEDFQYEHKHHLLDLGDREGLGWRDELEGTMHQIGVPLGHELDPGYRRGGGLALSRRHKRDQLALVQVLARTKCLKAEFFHRGRGTLRLCSHRGGDRGTLEDMPYAQWWWLKEKKDGWSILIAVVRVLAVWICGGSPFLGFMMIVLKLLCCMGDLMLLLACEANLVTHGLLAGSLGCIWPSTSPLRGGVLGFKR